MQKIGITGQNGFIGTYLQNTLRLQPDKYELIDFKRIFFDTAGLLDLFVSNCDVIVHLATVNRHNDPEFIYNTNIDLTNKLIASLKRTKSKAHIIFASSIQEENENWYGKSKKKSRNLFIEWEKLSEGKFTGFIIPNVFGPFGSAYHNSVIATFCYQLTHGETPRIETDVKLRLLYVGELVSEILMAITNELCISSLKVKHTKEIKVSEVLQLLKIFEQTYLKNGSIPNIRNIFELHLFITFMHYLDIRSVFPVKYHQRTDSRGSFTEIIRLNTGGQVSYSVTRPGATRGNHFHTRKIERFSVISGEASIQMRQIGTNDVIEFHINGNEPSYVDMPAWYTHNIKNVGNENVYTIFWINEVYDNNDPDTYFEAV